MFRLVLVYESFDTVCDYMYRVVLEMLLHINSDCDYMFQLVLAIM